MGLPGSGKTYLTKRLVPLLSAAWFNADKIREMANDWDFSDQGRLRQSNRMKTFADFEKSHGRLVVCDFVCPTINTRQTFGADFTVWMDTIKEGRFEDTNKMFEKPTDVNYHVANWFEDTHAQLLPIIKNYMERNK